jgi:hypothetical protein
MAQVNLPITSREYKLMLNVERFQDRQKGAAAFQKIIDFVVETQLQGSVVDRKTDEEIRLVSYLDTPEMALHYHDLIVRVRVEDNQTKHKVTLKYRASDRYVSAAQDVSSSQDGKLKFEEDIIPPFVSKFSKSMAVKFRNAPTFASLKALQDTFPGLQALDIPETSKIETVNQFQAQEIFIPLCQIKFGVEPLVNAALSFWYFSEVKSEAPVVAEFSFDYEIDVASPQSLEQFPAEVVEKTNHLFGILQKHTDWLNLSQTTKTLFAMEQS